MKKIPNKKTFALLLSVVLVISAIPAVMPAMATTPSYPLSPDDPVITSALDYLRSVQGDDGNISGFGTSAWVVMAIAAAGEDPHEWKTAPDNPSIVDYLKNNANDIDTEKATDWERSILAIVAACEDPTNFGGVDYVAGLKSLWDYDNNQMDELNLLNDDFWGILALVAAGEDPTSEMIQGSAAYIKANRGSHGGWSWATLDHPWYSGSDVDDTAAAIMALIAAGESPSSVYITDALTYLWDNQDTSGGFASWDTVNSASTSWAVDAIVAAGQDPTSDYWTYEGNNPVDYLLSLQGPLPAQVSPPAVAVPGGAFIYCRPDPSWAPYVPGWEAFEWMTSYSLPALLGKQYPVPCPGIPATVIIEPETLNLKSNGQWVTAYIELPEGYNVSDIDVNTTLLDCEVPAVNDTQYGFVTDPASYLMDHDGDGIQERMVKFNRTAVIEYIGTYDFDGDTGDHKVAELFVTGEVAGAPFEGSDTVRVRV